MNTRTANSYWERACHFFRSAGFADSTGTYFIHNKNRNTVKIGSASQISVSVGDEFLDYTEDGRSTATSLQSEEGVFKLVEELLRKDAPFFFLASPDINRQFADNSLPKALFVQPAIEFTFSQDHCNGRVSYAKDSAGEQQGRTMLRTAAQQPLPAPPKDAGEPRTFTELAVGWLPAEDDESFLKRLVDAVNVLQDYPDGKMALTRAYEGRQTAERSPFELYELHARINGEYASSHFCCIRQDVFSLGTTPENVFEINDETLTVDVVAATCKASDSDGDLAEELYENPKQIKEHESSLSSRQNRFRPHCRDSSIRVIQNIQVKKLRNVCHLHSVFTGELLPQVTMFDLMENIFPLLGARPRELLNIADSEKAPHRYYGGMVGHMHNGTGGAFLNIRNVLLDNKVMHAKVGVGVIKESDAYSELLETRDKLSGLLEAIYTWQQQAAPEC